MLATPANTRLISGRQRLNTEMNFALAQLKLRATFGGNDQLTLTEIFEIYHMNANILRSTPTHDIAFRTFFTQTSRLVGIAATYDYHRTDKPRCTCVAVPARMKEDLQLMIDMYDLKWKTFQSFPGDAPNVAICLDGIPEEDLGDFLQIIRGASLHPLTYMAWDASPFTWQE